MDTSSPVTVPPPGPKNRTGLWIGLGAGCLLLLCCFGIVAVAGTIIIANSASVQNDPIAIPVTSVPQIKTATIAPIFEATAVVAPAEATPMPEDTSPAPTPDGVCMGAQPGDELRINYVYGSANVSLLDEVLWPLREQCGLDIMIEASMDIVEFETQLASGNTYQAAIFSVNSLPDYAHMLSPISDFQIQMENYNIEWFKTAEIDQTWYGLPLMVNTKSLIWYNPSVFEQYGYTVPATYPELKNLVEEMVSDGNIPWAMGMESGSATGWTGSDFIQNILLSTQGPYYIQGLMEGSMPYNDVAVADAFTDFGLWAGDDAYTVDGATGTITINFIDAINLVYSDPPQAMMVMQADFADAVIYDVYSMEFGVDYDFFEFPGVTGHQVFADALFAFDDSPATRALFYYLSGAQAGESWAEAGLGVTPNLAGLGRYPDPINEKIANMLAGTAGYVLDFGDYLGDPFKNDEWLGITDYLTGADLLTVLNSLMQSQQQALDNR